MLKIGKREFLCEAFDTAGRSRLVIWSQPLMIYQRKNGTYFYNDGTKRSDLTLRSDGTFYKAFY